MPLRSIINTARTLSYYTRLQQTTANNLANVSTAGFKGDRLTARQSAGDPHPVPVQAIDLRQGTLRDTGRPFDLALKGDGFLVVQTPQGERLTRGGSLGIGNDGTLVDNHGDAILGSDGPINVSGRRVEIGTDGSVSVDGKSVGQLRVETVADPSTLTKEGAGRFIPGGATQAATSVTVAQGALEDANVDPLLGTVDLITIQRAYAANLDVLKTMDGVMGTVTNELGRV
ncbi:MAG: flagellar hook basal-body protein [Gemmatimonadales bacterium]